MNRSSLAAVIAAVLAAPAVAQTPAPPPASAPPAPTPVGPVPPATDKKADPVSPQKAEQEPRPVAQELQKQAAQGGGAATGAPSATAKADEKPKWDVNNPPGPTKVATIDTTTGTWMSLDVSPDGREVVFDLLGDLYVIPISGGEARALTKGVAWDMQPRYSPNGKWIAFTSDRGGGDNLWIMDRDGTNLRQVSKETFRLLNQPVWTPDSEYLIGRKHFTSSRSLGGGEMWMYHRTGGDGVQLTTRRTQQKDTGEPAVSPDGRYVYFSDDSTPGGVFEYSKDVNEQIYVIQRLDRQTGQVQPYITGPGGSIRPTPSHDGKRLAFIRRDRYKSTLYVKDLESGAEVPIFDGLDRDMQETWAVHGVYPTIAWTPDDKQIVFWAEGKLWRVDAQSKAVAEIPFRVRTERAIQDAVRFRTEVAPDRFDVKMIRFAQVAPKGDRVVYEALGKLWVRDLPNGAPRRLTKQADHFELYPTWSRDGRSIAYVTWDDEKLGSVRVVSAAGGEGRVVTQKPGHYVEPAFSPDGRTVAYRKTSDGFLTSGLWSAEPGLYVAPAAGGAAKKVSDKGQQPQFGAANDRLFFVTNEPESKRAFRSVDLDGSDERTHLISANAAEFSISPDQKHVAWVERFNAYVAPFVVTGKAVEIGPDGKAFPQTRLTRDAGDWVHWSGDGRKLWWTLGPELFSRDLKDAFTFEEGAPAELPKPAEKGLNIAFSAPYDKPAGRYALTGARIVTMRGDEVIENGVVVVNGNRIETVGPLAATTIPAGTRTIDVTGKTIVPGFIDGHWHGSMGTEEIIPEQSWVDYASLAFGVTTIHDPSNDTSEIFAHSELAKAGEVVAPRIFSTGTILYGATTAFTAKVDSLDDALGHLRRLKAAGADSVKSYNQPRRDQRQQVIEAARQVGMNVVPEGGSLFQHNMTMIADGHTTIEHSLPVAHVYDDVKQFWKQSGTGYNPTLVVAYGGPFGENYWYEHTDVWKDPILTKYVPRRLLDARSRRPVKTPPEEMNLIEVARTATELNRLGVKTAIGAHGQREGLGTHWDMWSFVLGGMRPIDALRSATLNPAEMYGYDRDLGSLEAGKLADMVVLDSNPLENIRNTTSIRFTVLNGRVYDQDMNEIAPRQKKRAPFFHELPGGQTQASGVAGAAAHGHGED